MEKCSACQHGEGGVLKFEEEVEQVVGIETPMVCGCGGYVSHSVRHYALCHRWFLTTYEDHRAPSSADSSIHEIDGAEADRLITMFKSCPDPDNRDCGCSTHRSSEFLHKTSKGQRRYFEADKQEWSQ